MKNTIASKKKTFIELFKIALLVLLCFGINCYLTFAPDTYSTFDVGFGYAARDMVFRNGRPVIGLIYALQYISGLSGEAFYYISYVLAIVFLIIAIFALQQLLKKYSISENMRILISFVSVANIFIIEYFMFVEKCGFMLAVLFDVLGVCCMETYLRKRQAKYWLLAAILITLAIFTYQGTIALFVLLSVPFVYKYADSVKKYILNVITVGMAYAIPVVICLLAFKFVFTSTRINEEMDLLGNIKYAIYVIGAAGITTFNLLPWCMFAVICIVAFIISIVAAVKGEKTVKQLLHLIIVVLTCCIFPVATIIQGSGWLGMRLIYPLASIFGVFLINYYVNQKEATREGSEAYKRNTVIDKIVLMLIIVLLVGQYLSFNKLFIDKNKLNYADKLRVDYVAEKIAEYEAETGITVEKIAFYKDAYQDKYYPDVYFNGDLLVSSFFTDWSDVTAINYYFGTDYEKAECDEQMKENFSNKNWDVLSDEQFIFTDDTLHICVY